VVDYLQSQLFQCRIYPTGVRKIIELLLYHKSHPVAFNLTPHLHTNHGNSSNPILKSNYIPHNVHVYKQCSHRTRSNLFININQLDALNFIISLFQASTCFEHMCSSSGGQIVLHSLWYHHTETSEWSKINKIIKITKIQFYKYEHMVVQFMCEFLVLLT
jgi:hypothetical protein